MRTDKLTIKAQEALADAQKLALEHGQQQVEVEHLLAVLLQQKEGVIVPLIQKIGASPAALPSGEPALAASQNQFGMPQPMSQPGEAGGKQVQYPFPPPSYNF